MTRPLTILPPSLRTDSTKPMALPHLERAERALSGTPVPDPVDPRALLLTWSVVGGVAVFLASLGWAVLS